MAKKAVCIISGGMDSALSAAIAKKEGYEIIALHFNYGQRTEKKELECFRKIAKYLEAVEVIELDLDFFSKIGGSALVDESLRVPTEGLKPGIPITYVPFRNGIFLSIAAAVCEKEGAEAIYIGVVEEDSSGYPDCREDFINKMQAAINAGTKPETNISIKTPLVHLKKEDIVKEALKYGVPLENTWSCYQREDRACGVCDSCRLRLKGFEKAGERDRIEYETHP
ncbi:MAG: 7-cyano-7-deazaguanine synthase QueC [Epsilonproteobacteria bacterium]|nr:7-cyano-7-deazaguanine synthase QueC [Campylobacterota bacterium]